MTGRTLIEIPSPEGDASDNQEGKNLSKKLFQSPNQGRILLAQGSPPRISTRLRKPCAVAPRAAAVPEDPRRAQLRWTVVTFCVPVP